MSTNKNAQPVSLVGAIDPIALGGAAIQAPNLGQNLQNGNKLIETRSAPVLLGATHRAFTFYLGNPLFSILSIRFILSEKSETAK